MIENDKGPLTNFIMYFSLFIGGVVIFCAGGITMFLFLHKNILNELKTLKDLRKNSQEKLNEDFFALLSSNIDFSLYENAQDVIEFERQRIGTEAHDEFGAYLNSFYFNLQVLGRESHLLSEESNAILLTMRQTIKRAIISFRRIIYDMIPSVLENGTLDGAIEELCFKHDNTKGTRILFRSQGDPQRLTDKQNLNLYRIVQELLNNCLKHSNGWNIFITLEWNKQELKVIVKDTGTGIREDYVNKTGKYGMTGIFLRSIRIGAKAKFNAPLVGMEFELSLSLTEHREKER